MRLAHFHGLVKRATAAPRAHAQLGAQTPPLLQPWGQPPKHPVQTPSVGPVCRRVYFINPWTPSLLGLEWLQLLLSVGAASLLLAGATRRQANYACKRSCHPIKVMVALGVGEHCTCGCPSIPTGCLPWAHLRPFPPPPGAPSHSSISPSYFDFPCQHVLQTP